MSKQKYFKITNEKENHHGFQYKDGVNVLLGDFKETGECCPGGLYFTDINGVALFLGYGVWLRDVDLPVDDPEFKMVYDTSGGKWRANKIILGKKRSLYDLDTLKYLVSLGASLKDSTYFQLPFKHDNVEMFKYLVDKGCTIQTRQLIDNFNTDKVGICEVIIKNKIFTDIFYINTLLDQTISKNNLTLMKLILQNYPDFNQSALFRKAEFALTKEQIDCFKFLLTRSDDFVLTNDILCKLFYDCQYSIINYLIDENILVSQGVDFGAANNEIFIESVKTKNTQIIDFLSDKIDESTKKLAFHTAIKTEHLDTVKYIYEKFEIDTSNLEPLLYWIAPDASLDLIKFMVEDLGVDPTFNDNQAVKRAQRFRNKRVMKYLARTSSLMMKSRDAQFASANDL